jgi:hypothetical protein
MSGLDHFTLAHSGLRGSLHTLDGLPYVGPPNVRYIMDRDSFDDGTFTRKVWRPCHGALRSLFQKYQLQGTRSARWLRIARKAQQSLVLITSHLLPSFLCKPIVQHSTEETMTAPPRTRRVCLAPRCVI